MILRPDKEPVINGTFYKKKKKQILFLCDFVANRKQTNKENCFTDISDICGAYFGSTYLI
jgi:hypothetical protein